MRFQMLIPRFPWSPMQCNADRRRLPTDMFNSIWRSTNRKLWKMLLCIADAWKHGISTWNRISIYCTTKVITTSGFGAAMLNFTKTPLVFSIRCTRRTNALCKHGISTWNRISIYSTTEVITISGFGAAHWILHIKRHMQLAVADHSSFDIQKHECRLWNFCAI